jgi:hypothetical protein
VSEGRLETWADAQQLSAEDRESLRERAALIEHQDNVTRYTAEGMAIRQWMEGKR